MLGNKFQDLIKQISRQPKKRLEIFRSVKENQQRNIVLRLSKYVQYDIVSKLSDRGVVDLLKNLDTDEAGDILRLLPPRRQKAIIRFLNENLKIEASSLLIFDPETVMDLLDVNYIQVEHDDTIISVTNQVKTHEKRTGKMPTILIMKGYKLLGILPVYALGLAKPEDLAQSFVKKIKTVSKNIGTNKLLEIFRKNPHSKIVVLNEQKNIVGFIYSDNVLKLLHEKEANSLYDFAGVNQEESVFDNVKTKVGFRYKWLIINLLTAFLASFTVGLFDETISKYILLAVYMPIIAGMGGNSATQTLAVVVRGIALKQIDLKTMFRTLKNELGASFLNGLINGILVSLVVYFKDGDLRLALILAMAMVINLGVAAFFGTVVPLIMKRIGKDPASSATIFITTATDVLGFVTFLGLAALIL